MWVWSLGLEDSQGEGNGNSLQCLCLENPMDSWWATVHMVARSQTWLKQLSKHMKSEKLEFSCQDVSIPSATNQRIKPKLLRCVWVHLHGEHSFSKYSVHLGLSTDSLHQRIVNPDADLSAWGEENEKLTSSVKLLILCGCPRVWSWVMGFTLLCRQAQGSAVSSHSEKT